MKSRAVMYLLAAVFLASFVFAGCSTNPVAYSFSENEQNLSTIVFKNGNPGVIFVSFNGEALPVPEKGTHWSPISFPAGRELKIVVHAYYSTQRKTSLSGFGLLGAAVNLAQDVGAVSRNVDADVELVVSPLQAGKSYQLSFKKELGLPGKNILTLIDTETAQVAYTKEFEVTFGGGSAK